MITLRPMKYRDRLEVERLVRAAIDGAIVDHCGDPDSRRGWFKNTMRALSVAQHNHVAVAEAGLVVGYMGYSDLPHLLYPGSYLHCLYCSPAFQNMGVASRLLDHFEAEAREPILYLTSSMVARPFYVRRGWTADGNATRGAGLTWDFPMKKRA